MQSEIQTSKEIEFKLKTLHYKDVKSRTFFSTKLPAFHTLIEYTIGGDLITPLNPQVTVYRRDNVAVVYENATSEIKFEFKDAYEEKHKLRSRMNGAIKASWTTEENRRIYSLALLDQDWVVIAFGFGSVEHSTSPILSSFYNPKIGICNAKSGYQSSLNVGDIYISKIYSLDNRHIILTYRDSLVFGKYFLKCFEVRLSENKVEEITELWNVETNDVWIGSDDVAIRLDNDEFVGCNGKNIEIRSCRTGQLIRKIDAHQTHARSVCALGNDLVASGGGGAFYSTDNDIHIWNIKTGQLQVSLSGHQDKIFSLAIYLNRFLISSSGDKSVKIWDLETFKLVQELKFTAVNLVKVIDDNFISIIGENKLSYYVENSVLATIDKSKLPALSDNIENKENCILIDSEINLQQNRK